MSKWQNPEYINSVLPDGVKIKEPIPLNYNYSKKHVFIDPVHGEWETSPRFMIEQKRSTHPKRSASRRLDNYKQHPGKMEESRKKAQETIKLRYSKEEFKQLQIRGNRNKFGTDWASQTKEFQEKKVETLKRVYGVENVMQIPEVQLKNLESCAKNNKFVSSGEKEIESFIKLLGFETEKKILDFKQFDICIESKKLLIEYNGLYFHNELNSKITNNYHLNKTKIANKHGYRLIHIFDKEWLDNKDKFKGFLSSALGVNTIKIHARKCVLRTVEMKEARDFLNKYHLLGYTPFKRAFGLYFNDELVSMITINTHHRGVGQRHALTRFVNKAGINVLGGLSRLSVAATNEYGDIISWIDRRLAQTNNWEKAGWVVEDTLAPDYFYWQRNGNKVISKQSRRKNLVGTPKKMTEHEHALADGLARVYDCGKFRMVFKKKF